MRHYDNVRTAAYSGSRAPDGHLSGLVGSLNHEQQLPTHAVVLLVREPRVVSIGATWVRNPERLGEFGLGQSKLGAVARRCDKRQAGRFLQSFGIHVRGFAQQGAQGLQETLPSTD